MDLKTKKITIYIFRRSTKNNLLHNFLLKVAFDIYVRFLCMHTGKTSLNFNNSQKFVMTNRENLAKGRVDQKIGGEPKNTFI